MAKNHPIHAPETSASTKLETAIGHHQAGDLARAEVAYREILQDQPNHPDALHLLGLVAYQTGAHEISVEMIGKAIVIEPQAPPFHGNLANALKALGRRDDAVASYGKALELDPKYAEAHVNLADLLRAEENWTEAAEHYRAALARTDDLPEAWSGLANCLAEARPDAYDEGLERDLIACFDSLFLRHQDLAACAARHLKLKYALAWRDPKAAEAALGGEILGDALLHAYLTGLINTDPDLEIFFTALRRALLPVGIDRDFDDRERAAAAALALQCANNNYAFWLGDDEAEALAARRAELDGELADGAGPDHESALLCLAMYAPLVDLDAADKLKDLPLAKWSEPLRPVIQRALLDRLDEATPASTIPFIGIMEETDLGIPEGEDEIPHPRWRSLACPRPEDAGTGLHRRLPTARLPMILRSAKLEILIAGCGTGEEAVYRALAYDNVSVGAVDTRRGNVAYAARMARELGAERVMFAHGDIFHLSRMGRQFLIIECPSALNYVDEPALGWNVLNDLLFPGGLMRVGLMSRRGRRHAVAARAWARDQGIEPSAASLREFRRRVLAGEAPDDVGPVSELPEFFDLGACRDLLFHVERNTYSLPEVERMLAERGLEFVAFEFAGDEVARKYGARFPDDRARTDLANWAAFEEDHPDTFVGMYQVWCRKPAAE